MMQKYIIKCNYAAYIINNIVILISIMTINGRIQHLISILNLSPNAFASNLNMKATAIYNILNGRNKPSYDLLEKIIKSYDVKPDWLFTEEGDVFYNISYKTKTQEMHGSFAPDMHGGGDSKMNTDFVGAMNTSGEKKQESIEKIIEKYMDKPSSLSDVPQSRRDTYKFLRTLIKAHNNDDQEEIYSNFEIVLSLINTILSNYGVFCSKSIAIAEANFDKKVEMEVLISFLQDRITMIKQLNIIIEPYKQVVEELYKKICEFDYAHDDMFGCNELNKELENRS